MINVERRAILTRALVSFFPFAGAWASAQVLSYDDSWGSIVFSSQGVAGSNAGLPEFSGHQLITPGHGYKNLTGGNVVDSTSGTLFPGTLALEHGVDVANGFGGAKTSIFATGSGNPVGISWPTYTVAGIADDAYANVASVNYSEASAHYTLNSLYSADAWGWMQMGVSGHVNNAVAGSFAAASLHGTLSVEGGYNATGSITMFSDGDGGLQDGVYVTIQSSAPGNPSAWASVPLSGPSFSGFGWAWAFLGSSILPGSAFDLEGGLTLIAAGDASIGFETQPPVPVSHPDPFNDWGTVPEPGTVATLGLGFAAFFRRRRARNGRLHR